MLMFLDPCVVTGFLLKAFVDPDLFPLDERPSVQQVQRQKEAFKFYSIFEGRINAGEVCVA